VTHSRGPATWHLPMVVALVAADSRDRAEPTLAGQRPAGRIEQRAGREAGSSHTAQAVAPPASRILEDDDPSFVPSGRWNLPRHEVEWCFDDG
jgi:hypothetical protein